MRKLIALCCLLGILMLSACTPAAQPVGTTTSSSETTTTTTSATTTTTTTTPSDIDVSTDDTQWSDTDWSDNFTQPDDTEPSEEPDKDGIVEEPDEEVSGGINDIYKEILPEGNTANLMNPIKGGADAEADELREAILNSENAKYNITGVTYYVSPNGDDNNDGTTPETAWKTPDAIVWNSYLFEEGDAVLFERDGIYRRTSPIVVQSGVTYGAYGEGDKPLIYGSASNYAWGMRWEPSYKENVWKITLYSGEAGIIVFNHGEEVGMPYYHGLNELTQNGDFYHNTTTSTLYLYLDKGYPNAVYESIEIGTRETVFRLNDDTQNVTIDNLAIKYAGLFAVDVQEYTSNISITNCEMGWIGGCRFNNGDMGLGNAIQFWQNTNDALVENCWIYQVYDAGITPQGTGAASTYKNLTFRNNLIEYCNYSIEVFDRDTGSVWDGLVIENNIMRFAGYGWLAAGSRVDKSPAVAHYTGWTWNYDAIPGNGIVIKNNIFDCSAANLVYWPGKTYASGVTVSGNSFYQRTNVGNKAIAFGSDGQQFATNQAELEAAVSIFDSNPKVVKWLS